MPLLASIQPSGYEQHDISTVQLNEPHNLHTQREERDPDYESEYEDYDSYNGELEEERDLEGPTIRPSISTTKVPKTPLLPQRSEKRVPKMVESVLVELKSLDGSAPDKEPEQQSLMSSDPHELYLSSEEDGSLSDDYDDSLIDFEPCSFEDGEESNPSSRTSSRGSQEDTARVVSFTLVGKPQIIDIFLSATAASRAQRRLSSSLDSLSRPSSPKPFRRTEFNPNSVRPLSVCSISSMATSPTHRSIQNLHNFPMRKSSKIAFLFASTKNSLQHSFLSSDPFAAREASDSSMAEKDEEGSERSTTPNSATSTTWKKSFSRTISATRKPSMPNLSLSYSSGVSHTRAASKASLLTTEPAGLELSAPAGENDTLVQMTLPRPTTPTHEEPLHYESIVKNMAQTPPLSQANRKKSLAAMMGMGMGLSRKKSVKSKADK